MSLGNLGRPSDFLVSKISRKHLVHGNYTDENALIVSNPDVPYWDMAKDKVLDYIASASPNIYAQEGGLYKYFAKGGIEYVDSSTHRHRLRGTGKVMCIAVENIMKGVKYPGVNHSEVMIKLDQALYQSSDTIYPEHDPSLRFSVQGNPIPDSTGHIYRLVLHSRSSNAYVDPEILEQGVIWRKGGATFSEASGEYGSSYTPGGTSIYTYESNLGSYSKQHEVTDQAYLYALKLKALNKDGKVMSNFPDKILPMPEGEFFAQVRTERENDLFWGRAAGKNVIDVSTGLHRKIGEGIVEFFRDGNIRPYNRSRFSVGFLKSIFNKFFYGKVTPGRANITVWAGLGLMELVDEALTKEYARLPIERAYKDYVKPGATYTGSNTQGKILSDITFLGFDLKPYGRIEFKHLPMLEDTESFGGRVDKRTGKPEMSYWGFVNDLGIGTGQNIKILRRKESEQYTYVCGALSPVGYINRKSGKATGYHSADAVRRYTVHYAIQEGVTCKDTKRTMFLYPADRF